ncbi:hypothetical protein EJ02DRAFT_196978 [Clathrospora elynae]|uniref:Uncharacterized protein n=1 Tax=Clathrospora elynae TaxID=706981 RepID=A0A6A5T1F4_9PLEO|nr:hypothetical protein EJ02DRAFT_196978 [Clathrospora elynae]
MRFEMGVDIGYLIGTMLVVATLVLCLANRLYDSGCRGSLRDRSSSSSSRGSGCVAVDLSLRTVARDVAGFAATVAGLTSGVERAAVGRSAVTGDVTCQQSVNRLRIIICILTKLAAGVALHGLSLAIAGEMVRSAALVAGGRAGTASESAPEAASAANATTGRTRATAHSRVGAIAGEVTSKTAAIATSAGASSAQAQGRAVSLDVS